MGKYLNIAKRFEARLEKEEGERGGRNPSTSPQAKLSQQETTVNYRALYRQMAEPLSDDCFLIDPYWLIDAHPELWEQIKALDHSLSQLEQASVVELEYRHVLDRLSAVVRRARALYEHERSDEPARQ